MTAATDTVQITLRLTRVRVIKCANGGEVVTCLVQQIIKPRKP